MPPKAATVTPEDAVRLYLQFLDDPDSLRDEAAIAKAQAAVDKATDPIAKVRAFVALERAEALDPEVFRHGFITNVKAWMENDDISVSALQLVGVPDEDLIEAGLLAAQPVRRRARDAVAAAPKRNRAPRLGLDEVARQLPKKKFRLTDLAQAIEREPATTRNYLNKLLQQGIVVDAGDDPSHSGKGKAAKVYVRG
jgi:hypothetical protein